jgi:hypothetical protein
MKRIVLALGLLFAIVAFDSFVYGASGFDISNFSISLKGGTLPKNDNWDKVGKDYYDVLTAMGFSETSSNVQIYSYLNILDPEYAVEIPLGLDISYEHEIGNRQSLVFRAGFIHLAAACEYEARAMNLAYKYYTLSVNKKINSEATMIPINIAYQYDLTRKFKISGGAGVSILSHKYNIKAQYDTIYYVDDDIHKKTLIDSNKQSDTIVIPSINIGISFSMSRFFAIFADFGYQYSDKIKIKDRVWGTEFYEEYTGYTMMFGLRYYPFGYKKPKTYKNN